MFRISMRNSLSGNRVHREPGIFNSRFSVPRGSLYRQRSDVANLIGDKRAAAFKRSYKGEEAAERESLHDYAIPRDPFSFSSFRILSAAGATSL